MHPLKSFALLIPAILCALGPSTSAAETTQGTFGVSTTGFIAASSVSLTTGATTWGYISSTGTYLPNLATNSISTTTLSATAISIPTAPTATTDAANKAYVDTVVAASCGGGASCTTKFADRPSAGIGAWKKIAMSDDGRKLVALAGTSQIYVSNDSGLTWTLRPNPDASITIRDVAISGNGERIVIGYYATSYGYTAVSASNGASWNYRVSHGSSLNPYSVSINYDGTKIITAVGGSNIRVSTNGGQSFNSYSTTASWNKAAISRDGTKMLIASSSDYIYISTNGGTSWGTLPTPGTGTWTSLAISNDSTKIIAAKSDYTLWTYNSGTWTNRGTVGSAVALNGDGSVLIAGNPGVLTRKSTDMGATWTALTDLDAPNWTSLAVSDDGTKFAGSTDGGYLYSTACQ